MSEEFANQLLKDIRTIVKEEIKQEVSGIKQDISCLKQDVDNIYKKLGSMESDLTIIKISTIKMETEHNKKINILLEQYPEFWKKHDSHDEKFLELEKTTEIHSYQIDFLKQAK